MQFLAYYCATDMLQVEIINGNEKGSDIKNINDYTCIMKTKIAKYNLEILNNRDSSNSISDMLFPNKLNYAFLDHSNGDFYCFKNNENEYCENNADEATNFTNLKENDEWIPIGNFGMHNSYYVKNSKYQSQVQKTKAYKPNKHYIESQELDVITSKITDVKCELISKHISHFLLKDLPSEFCVCNTHIWDLHPVRSNSLIGSNGKFTELAESDSGPQIAIMENLVAIQFYILKENPETIKVLNNFINHYMNEIFENGGENRQSSCRGERILSINKFADLSKAIK